VTGTVLGPNGQAIPSFSVGFHPADHKLGHSFSVAGVAGVFTAGGIETGTYHGAALPTATYGMSSNITLSAGSPSDDYDHSPTAASISGGWLTSVAETQTPH